MPAPTTIPTELLHGPFTAAAAARHGVSEKVLRGSRFERLHPRVWVYRGYEMGSIDRIRAAALSMPDRAHLSHISRIQALGLELGHTDPVHFTVRGDLHIATDGIFLHRTEALPPLDSHGVSPAAAFVQYCATATTLEAMIAGDWLLSHNHMSLREAIEVAHVHDWRPGARQSVCLAKRLNHRSRSPLESHTRAIVEFAGLPSPEVNADVFDSGGRRIAIVDLLFRTYRLAIEYEGRQHALSASQFGVDIRRYADLRRAGYEYIQVTFEMLQQPRALALRIHEELRRRGYSGPPPTFGPRWHSLFEPISVPPRLRAVS